MNVRANYAYQAAWLFWLTSSRVNMFHMNQWNCTEAIKKHTNLLIRLWNSFPLSRLIKNIQAIILKFLMNYTSFVWRKCVACESFGKLDEKIASNKIHKWEFVVGTILTWRLVVHKIMNLWMFELLRSILSYWTGLNSMGLDVPFLFSAKMKNQWIDD